MTNHEYGQLCMQSELDQSDNAVLRLLLQHPSLCHLSLLHSRTYVHHRGPTAFSIPPVLHSTPCYPKLQQLQHYMKCHDIQLVQHCPTSCITVHSCLGLCTQQAQQRSSSWGVSTCPPHAAVAPLYSGGTRKGLTHPLHHTHSPCSLNPHQRRSHYYPHPSCYRTGWAYEAPATLLRCTCRPYRYIYT